MEKELLAALSTILGLSAEEVKAKVEAEGAEKNLTDLHASKVAADKEAVTKQVKKTAEKELRKTVEEEFTASLKEKYGVETDATGLALVEQIVSTSTEKLSAEDNIKKHPAYLALEKQKETEVKAAKEEAATKISEIEKGVARKELLKGVKEKALAEFDALNPILPNDANKAAARRKQLEAALEQLDYQPEGEGYLILNADGSRLEDAHQNPIKFSDFVKSTADNLGFEFKVAEPRSSTGTDPNNPGSTENVYTGAMPKNLAEYTKLATDRSIPLPVREDLAAKWAEINN